MIQVIILILFILVVRKLPNELSQESIHNIPVTVGGIVGACVVLTVGVFIFIFILR